MHNLALNKDSFTLIIVDKGQGLESCFDRDIICLAAN